jgi:peptidase E
MTTYLLHGGATSKDLLGNDNFFAQFTALVDKPKVKILLCYFSRKKEEWEKLTKRDTKNISTNADKDYDYHVVKNSEDLFKKLPDYDVLYVAGGDAELLEPFYKELSKIKTMLSGKIYAGSSMGTFMASESYVLSNDAQDSDSVHKGIGLLPIQTLCHWDVENKGQNKMELLMKYSKTPIIALNEGELVKIYR